MNSRFFAGVSDGNGALDHHPRRTSTHPPHLLKLWNWFQSYLVAMNIHEDGISCRHSPFDEILLGTIANFVELAQSPNLPRGDALLTVTSFGLLVISIRHTAFGENGGCAEEW